TLGPTTGSEPSPATEQSDTSAASTEEEAEVACQAGLHRRARVEACSDVRLSDIRRHLTNARAAIGLRDPTSRAPRAVLRSDLGCRNAIAGLTATHGDRRQGTEGRHLICTIVSAEPGGVPWRWRTTVPRLP